MGKLMEENIEGKVRSNVFYDSFKETVEFYQDANLQIWEEEATIVIIDSDEKTGLFNRSDIIIKYDKETGAPNVITERIYRKNYKFLQWVRLKRFLRNKIKVIKQELGFNIRVSFNYGLEEYIDYIHYKEEWWKWALNNADR